MVVTIPVLYVKVTSRFEVQMWKLKAEGCFPQFKNLHVINAYKKC